MKILKILALPALMLFFAACSLDIPNPNAATEQDVLNTKDGLLALAKGMEQHFATFTLPNAILFPGISGHEIAATSTFSSLEELEDGGTALSGENERVSRLFATTMRTKGMAESILDNVDNVSMSAGTQSGLKALAALYRGMCIGILAYNWEKVPVKNSKNNDAAFVDRIAALREAVGEMEAALNGIESNAPSNEFTDLFSIDLKNALNMYMARFSLIAGDYDKAIDFAQAVDPGAEPSFFYYDSQNKNGVYTTMFEGTPQYAPRDNFGLPASLAPDPGDERRFFYLSPVDKQGNHYEVDSMVAPFFTAADAGIPVIYPGEADLIQAEAYARKNDFANAEAKLNAVRSKSATQDALGIGANLAPDFTANGDMDALLAEIFKNRRIELYLTGLGLEDSRRLGRPNPPNETDYSAERNRNFYPYPADERLNNPNTPQDPPI